MSERRSEPRQTNWRVFAVLMLGAAIGALALVPYTLALLPTPPTGSPPLQLLILASVVQTLVLTAIAAGVGLWLGDRVGLGAPLLRDWLSGDPSAPRRFVATLPLAITLGVLAAVVIIVLDLLVYAPRIAVVAAAAQSTASPSPWVGLLSALYGAIDEEILLRLGLMTVLVWLITRVTRASSPRALEVWAANLLCAVFFGLGHLPATAAILPLTPLVISRAIVLNGLAGIAFGWLYWRRGLLAAMAAHFASDVVLHAIAPALIRVGLP